MLEKLFQSIKRVLRRNKIRKINKEKFIEIVTRQLEEHHAKEGGVFIPEFQEAKQIYNAFKSAGCFDENGYLKPMNPNKK